MSWISQKVNILNPFSQNLYIIQSKLNIFILEKNLFQLEFFVGALDFISIFPFLFKLIDIHENPTYIVSIEPNFRTFVKFKMPCKVFGVSKMQWLIKDKSDKVGLLKKIFSILNSRICSQFVV